MSNDTLDKFYTNSIAVELCINKLKETIKIDYNTFIIEPSAGNGSFIHEIKKITNNYIFIDIKPEHNEILQHNFLEYLPPKNKYSKIIILGNPPFGRQSSLATKFIKHSCTFCDVFAFILPCSFKKESLKKRIPLNYHLIHEIDIPKNSFIYNNCEYNVPCVFQIWEKKPYKRQQIDLLKPDGFIFVKQNESPNISFRRVGINAGEIDKNFLIKSKQSHYFIKFENQIDDKILDLLKNIKFNDNNTVGPRSISKQEIIKEFNCILFSHISNTS